VRKPTFRQSPIFLQQGWLVVTSWQLAAACRFSIEAQPPTKIFIRDFDSLTTQNQLGLRPPPPVRQRLKRLDTPCFPAGFSKERNGQ
jgi:hypothetical protein